MVFFFSIAVAAAAGGTVHGFFLDKSLLGYRISLDLRPSGHGGYRSIGSSHRCGAAVLPFDSCPH
jgi:hypothetical protein